MPNTRIPLIFGTMTMGQQGKNGVRNHDLKECQEIINVFLRHGHTELDTARMYAEGTTEKYLARLELKNCTVDTKVFPVNPGDHSPERLRTSFKTSLEKLAPLKARVLYLHAPDRNVPFEETLREVNELYKEELFGIFGLSNFAAWEVSEVVLTCRKNGWIQPKIYQAMYNAITRSMESELVPCCRKFGIKIVIYNPLAGGFFAGKLSSANDAGSAGGRFDPKNGPMGTMYRNRYVKDGYFRALELLKEIAGRHNLRLTEIALRWTQHHSLLTPEDGVILGASSVTQLEQNCEDCEKGPLPDEVVAALDEAHKTVGFDAPLYWR